MVSLLLLLTLAPTAVQEGFTQTNESLIHGKFASLLEFVQMKLQKGLGAEKVERELRLFIIRLFNLPANSIPVSSDVAELLEAMRSQKLLTYLNVAGLEQVIKHFCEGDSETESKMEQYKKDRSGFELATKIKESDYISKAKSKFPDGCDKPAFDLQPKQTPAYLTELAVKLDHCVAEHHLDYLQELWKLLSNVLSLPPLYILLDAVIMSSILVVWLIPTDTVPEATERAKQNANFFRMHPILTVTIGDECVYSTTEPTGEWRKFLVGTVHLANLFQQLDCALYMPIGRLYAVYDLPCYKEQAHWWGAVSAGSYDIYSVEAQQSHLNVSVRMYMCL